MAIIREGILLYTDLLVYFCEYWIEQCMYVYLCVGKKALSVFVWGKEEGGRRRKFLAQFLSQEANVGL